MLKDPPAVTHSESVYQVLLVIYPGVFRREYGPAMAQLFRDQCREAYGRERVWGLCKTWLGTLRDLRKSAATEHISTIKRKFNMSQTQTPFLTPSRRRWMAAAFILVFASIVLFTSWLPSYYAGTARIAVHKDVRPDARATPAGGAAFDPYFIQTEFERLQSKEVLYRVIDELRLKAIWAKKYGLPGELQPLEAYFILRKRLDIRSYHNTSLLEIRVLDEDRNEAATIANKIAEVYREMRVEHLRIAAMQGIDTLQTELLNSEKKVAAAQEKVLRMREQENISDALADEFPAHPGGSEQLRQLESQVREAERAQKELQSQYARLSHLPSGQLMAMLPTACPDTLLTELLVRRAAAEQDLAGLQKELGQGNPTLARTQAILDKVNQQVEARIQGILAGLKFKVDSLASDHATRLEAWQTALKLEAEQARKYSAYTAAKRELEFEKQMGQTLSMKVAQEQLDAKLSTASPIEIVDPAEPGLRPVRPNWPVNILMGMLLGVCASLVTALIFLVKNRLHNGV